MIARERVYAKASAFGEGLNDDKMLVNYLLNKYLKIKDGHRIDVHF